MIEKEINDAERKKCKFCGKLFIPKLSWQRFCNPAHQKAYWRKIQNDKYETNRRLEELEKGQEKMKKKLEMDK